MWTKFVQVNGRDPTDSELVDAHVRQYEGESEQTLDREEPVHDADEEDIEHDADDDLDTEMKDVVDEVEGQSEKN